ncbi:MAG: hypothetical protein KME17_28650 [Cyanosarcina radialis HA8281-LM2]|jgi:tyrosinase|nr:hypothetical protein [Cyanosarcina radialis HA8281-LM2]
MAAKFISPLITLKDSYRTTPFYRADIIFEGVDRSGISYEGRVFLNNPNADENTPTTLENGYADSFYVFGHGGCFGDPGHCDLRVGSRPYDRRSQHPLTPLNIRVTATDAIEQILQNGNDLTVTVVPVVHAPDDRLEMDRCLKFKKFNLEIYDLPDGIGRSSRSSEPEILGQQTFSNV